MCITRPPSFLRKKNLVLCVMCWHPRMCHDMSWGGRVSSRSSAPRLRAHRPCGICVPEFFCLAQIEENPQFFFQTVHPEAHSPNSCSKQVDVCILCFVCVCVRVCSPRAVTPPFFFGCCVQEAHSSFKFFIFIFKSCSFSFPSPPCLLHRRGRCIFPFLPVFENHSPLFPFFFFERLCVPFARSSFRFSSPQYCFWRRWLSTRGLVSSYQHFLSPTPIALCSSFFDFTVFLTYPKNPVHNACYSRTFFFSPPFK